MKVKIFQGLGRDEIDDLEGTINEWLAVLPDTTKVLSTESSAAGGLNEGGVKGGLKASDVGKDVTTDDVNCDGGG